MQDTQEKVKNRLINIFNKKSKSLPEWRSLKRVANLAKENKENEYFATLVYYAIKDLFKIVGWHYLEFVEINNKTKTATVNEVYALLYRVGSTVKRKSFKPDNWELFKDANLQILNEQEKKAPILKMDNYLIRGNEAEVIEAYLNTKEVSENIDNIFLPVIDPEIRPLTFEEAIKSLKEEPKKIKKVTDEWTFEDYFKYRDGAVIALTIIERLDAVNKIKEDRKGEYLYGIVAKLKSEGETKAGIGLEELYKVFCKKLEVKYSRHSRILHTQTKAYREAQEDAIGLVNKIRSELKKVQVRNLVEIV